jgi:Mn-dependent DtxR family transcriptional regulator
MITNTSLEAFDEIIPELGERRLQVYKALKKLQLANNKMISKYLSIPLSSVCGRMNELRNKSKLVTFAHKGACPYTKKTTNFYKII